MSEAENKLTQLRQEIDAIDQQLVDLINQRVRAALNIGDIKKLMTETSFVYRPEREAQILDKIKNYNQGPLSADDISHIFRTILSISRALQQPLKIAFLGPKGTFSHAAALQQFGTHINLSQCDSILQVFQQIELKQAHYGIVPIENSSEGVVNITLDNLIHTSLKICGEIILEIHQHLLINPDHKQPVTRIYSHTQSLAQCQNWLAQHYPTADKIAVASNALAAKLAKEEPGAAAIAGDLAVEEYGLEKLASNIEDSTENMTRFFVLGHQEVPPSGQDKTTLLLHTVNEPGALAKIAQPFFKHNINITLPIVRPSRQKVWNYVFFFDVEGHHLDKQVQLALNEVKSENILLRILGSYPKAGIC